MSREDEIIKERLKKLEELHHLGINPYPHHFDKKQTIKECLKTKLKTKVKTAARVLTIRDFGKIAFAKLRDSSGEIQIVFQDGKTPIKDHNFFQKYIDTGDFLGVEGEIIKTKTGELSILVKKLQLLSKSILPLPSQWHGLQDKEERYRKRYLDLIMNSEVSEIFKKREKIIDSIRDFLKKQDFLEVETPAIQTLYGGAEARPFITELYALKLKLYLSISPEIYLKKLLIGDLERIFTITKNFRNEGIDKWHNPEFTMMEIYAAYWDYNDIKKMTEQLFETLAKKITGKTKINYQGKEIDFKAPYKVMRLAESIEKYAKINPNNLNQLKKEAEKLGVKGNKNEMTQAIFDGIVQPQLIQPTFIIDYPKSISPLTKDHRINKDEVERFELFINGVELANAYTELNDPIEQEKRLNEQIELRKKSGKFEAHFEANIIDEDFINAMKYGMPPAGGIGIGIDRLTVILTNQPSIRDVILFPFMKPETSEEKKEK